MFLNQTRAFHFPSKSHIMQSRQAMAQRMLALWIMFTSIFSQKKKKLTTNIHFGREAAIERKWWWYLTNTAVLLFDYFLIIFRDQ